MSVELEFQKLIYSILTGDTAFTAVVGSRIYDDVPDEREFPYISFGPHEVVDDDADCIIAGEHSFQIDIWSRSVGSVEAKQIMSLVKSLLHNNETEMTVNALASMRVDSRRVFRDPDGKTTHGVLNVTAQIEER